MSTPITATPLPILCAWCPPARRVAAPEGTPVSHTMCAACQPEYRRNLAALGELLKQTNPKPGGDR